MRKFCSRKKKQQRNSTEARVLYLAISIAPKREMRIGMYIEINSKETMIFKVFLKKLNLV